MVLHDDRAEKIRLYGIDYPEKRQPLARGASWGKGKTRAKGKWSDQIIMEGNAGLRAILVAHLLQPMTAKRTDGEAKIRNQRFQ